MSIPQHIANAVVDPNQFVESSRIDETLAWVRQNAPLEVAEPDGFDPFWLVSRHADILEIERNNKLFLNTGRVARAMSKSTLEQLQKAMAGGAPPSVLLGMDDPEHMKYRRVIQNHVMPAELRKLEDRFRAIARRFVDGLVDSGEQCDFVKQVSLLYPLNVIMEIMGIPPSEEGRMLKLTQEVVASTDPELNRSGTDSNAEIDMQSAMAAMQEFAGFFGGMMAQRRAAPTDDLASVIANGMIDGAPIDPRMVVSFYIILATAGHDTTSSTVGGGMWALAENPDQFAKVKADPKLIPLMVQETLRWTTPVKHFMRTAADDAEVSGRKIAKGDWLMMCYPSGNRDEAVFDEPFMFNVERSPNPHLTYGHGVHKCVGAHLANLEMRILWEELLPRIKSVEFDGEPRLVKASHIVGPKTLPLRFRFA
jgi:cytochrome P450